MVRREIFEGKQVYVCEECGFGYSEKRLALMCEEFCKRVGACSGEITKLAIMKPIA